MGVYLGRPVGPFRIAAGVFYNTFTTRQDISPRGAGIGDLSVVQGGSLEPGMQIEINAAGVYSTTATPSLTLGFYIGTQAGAVTTAIAESAAIVCGTATLWPWEMSWTGLVTAPVGTTASVTGQGHLKLGTSLTAYSTTPIPVTDALRTFTWDATIARAVGVCATWTASSSSNTIKTNWYNVTILNGP